MPYLVIHYIHCEQDTKYLE